MKIGDVLNAIPGMKKKSTSPIIVLGPLSPEEEGAEIRKSISDGKCPRDGADITGKEFCPGCGGKVSVMLAVVEGFKK